MHNHNPPHREHLYRAIEASLATARVAIKKTRVAMAELRELDAVAYRGCDSAGDPPQVRDVTTRLEKAG